MKTAEITRHKQATAGMNPPGTWAVFMDIYRREGIKGINKGVNAVALRQMTNWGSRMGFARLAESFIRSSRGLKETDKLGAWDKIFASSVGGALGCWKYVLSLIFMDVDVNSRDEPYSQPIEVVRVEMQSMAKSAATDAKRPVKMTVLKYIVFYLFIFKKTNIWRYYSTLQYVYSENGMKGLYRGVTPRIGLGIWQTICMVAFSGE